MPRPQRPWFRLYVEATSDRKLRRVTPAQRWLWVCVLAAARQSPTGGVLLIAEGQPMDATDIADVAALAVKEVELALPLFATSRMLDWDTELDAWHVTNWDARQFESDKTTERTRRHRRNVPSSVIDRSREHPNVELGTFPGTPPETEADTKATAASLSGSRDPRAEGPAAAAPNPSLNGTNPQVSIVDAAVATIAQRHLAAAKGQVSNPGGWLRSAESGLRRDLDERIGTADLAAFETAEQLADWLEPPHKPNVATQLADRQADANYARYDDNNRRQQHPCPTCDGNRRIFDDDSVAITCGACQGTGVGA
ncbi:MAG: phage replisome organizer N-terminal domain-containing protein [Actinomycetota bacterium]|nr:phage replisome organizer N-terminal domain-containing protein [Actinomycetota bacterium]